MTSILLKDILISARQESHRMRHHYLGVEHLFIALLEIKGGLTSNILSDYGLSPEYVIDAVRRKSGKGSRHRLWAGMPDTPRTQLVMSIAQDIAADQARQHIEERDLLIAILEENDNIPARVVRSLGLDMDVLRDAAATRQINNTASQTFTAVEFMPDFKGELDNSQLFILRRMFHGSARIRIESQLTGGYTGAILLVVTPIHIDNREQASFVVKIGPTDQILDEAQRYERYVKGTLPPLTARLEDHPVAPDSSELAGLKYTFLSDSQGNPTNMRGVIHSWTNRKLGEWLHQHLYRDFGENWWKQNRPYRFEAWREYDWMLPPMLTLYLINDDSPAPNNTHIIRFPIRRSRIQEFEFGDSVTVENFVVQKVDREARSIRLALGQGANTARPYPIEIRGIDFEHDTFYRGEVVEQISGTIYHTRDEQLMMAARSLEPDFDITGDTIGVNGIKMPNPIKAHHNLLDMVIEGTLSTIHGDLHMGNILIGPNDSALLIDFAHTRDGHTLFDWANLEMSILSEVIVPQIENSWDGARSLLNDILVINQADRSASQRTELEEGLQVIISLRKIVAQSLAKPDNWGEYYLSLAICALRAMLWDTMSLCCRRVMLLLAAFAMHEVNNQLSSGSANTPTADTTDFFTSEPD